MNFVKKVYDESISLLLTFIGVIVFGLLLVHGGFAFEKDKGIKELKRVLELECS